MHVEGKGQKQGKVLKITFFRFMCLLLWTMGGKRFISPLLCVFNLFWQQGEIFFQTLLLFADSIILPPPFFFLAYTNKIPSRILRIIRSLYVGRCIGKLMTAPLNC